MSFRPENRLNAQLALARNHHANVMAEDLAKHFILHGNVALAPHSIAEFGLSC